MLSSNQINKKNLAYIAQLMISEGAQWLSGRMFNLRSRGRWFERHHRHCIVFLSNYVKSGTIRESDQALGVPKAHYA